MLSHFMPHPRADKDITNIDRFFGDQNPEDVDAGDFYGDEAQIMWCSLLGYLQFLKGIGFTQQVVATDTIGALSELHIAKEYPTLLQGIVRSTSECLQDGFDLAGFVKHYASSEEQFFRRW